MSVSAIQQASRVLRKFEGHYQPIWDDSDEMQQELAAALRRLRAESLEVISALAACMMDKEIGPRAIELSRAVHEAKIPEAFMSEGAVMSERAPSTEMVKSVLRATTGTCSLE